MTAPKKDEGSGLLPKLEEMAQRYEELERLLADPEVLKSPRRYAAYLKEHGALGKIVPSIRQFKSVQSQLAETEALLADPKQEEDFLKLAREEKERLENQHQQILQEIQELLLAGEEEDRTKAIVEIRAGTGGEEAALFAADLFRMYSHYADKKGWKLELLSTHSSDLGGFREAIFSVSGKGAFADLNYESGGHRVQRVPVTESGGRIHTSASTVAVLPEAGEVEVEISPEDLKIDVFRASGPGGQHVNKVSSAVRITHLPTGETVNCQMERSQHKNKLQALRILRSRLYQKEMEKLRTEREDKRRLLIGSGDRSQRIRTYNFPQNRVTDHRTAKSYFDLSGILMGDLDPIIQDLKSHSRQKRLKELVKSGK